MHCEAAWRASCLFGQSNAHSAAAGLCCTLDCARLHCVRLTGTRKCIDLICDMRRLATLLGGDLHLPDRTDGAHGVRYPLRIPLRVATAPDAAFSPRLSVSLRPLVLRKTVLVVDDSEGNRRLARRMLLQLGCEVVECHKYILYLYLYLYFEASDGDEVLAALAAASAAGDAAGQGWGHAVDVVLMDIEMARLDGLGALAEMRRAGWSIPVIAATGNADAATVADCTLPLLPRARKARGGAATSRADLTCALVQTCPAASIGCSRSLSRARS
jgi:CheY-like chemotaxis protein